MRHEDMRNFGLERWDAEKLLFLSRLVQRGVSQTSQEGLERWVYILEVSLMVELVCLSRTWLTSTPGRVAGRTKIKSLGSERDARHHSKGVGFLVAFVSTPPQYISVGELDTENAALVQRGLSHESVQRHTLAWNFPVEGSRARATKVYCTGVLHRGKRGTLSLRGTVLKRLGPSRTSIDALII